MTPGTSSTTVQAQVQPDVPVVVQEQGTPLCWAAAATMMASWKAGKKLAPEEALGKAGEPYLTLFKNKLGLPSNQKDGFMAAMGMAVQPPASYPPSQFANWMKNYGPLWVTTDAAL